MLWHAVVTSSVVVLSACVSAKASANTGNTGLDNMWAAYMTPHLLYSVLKSVVMYPLRLQPDSHNIPLALHTLQN